MAEAHSAKLWVDKYRPRSFDELELNTQLSERLKQLCSSNNFPHLLVYGPSGSGKKTRIAIILRELFGDHATKLKLETKNIKIPNKTTHVDLVTVSSSYHIELNPSDVGNQDRVVVQEVIKEIAQTTPLDATERPFKVVVLNEVDKLSKEAQHGLRRTMEKYMTTCRLILCCNSTCKVIEPVRSRCLMVRVPAPSVEEISKVLVSVCKKEKIVIPNELATRIAEQSERNLRRAILMLEATKNKHYPFQPQQPVDKADWEIFIIQLAKEIAEEQSQKRLLAVRGKLYELISHCIPPEVIIKSLTNELLKKLDSELKYELIKWAAFYEHRMQLGNKAIVHLEAFVAKFMAIYKRFLMAFSDY